MNELIYKISDKPPFKQLLLFSLQQLLAIVTATIAVPAVVGNGMQSSAALFGAGAGTMIYLICTKFRSPVFLGSSFAYIGPMIAAFSGGVSMSLGYLGIIIGASLSGLTYVTLSFVVKKVGIKWLDVIMPPVVIGPTVIIIGLSLSSSAVNNILKDAVLVSSGYNMNLKAWLGLITGLVSLIAVVISAIHSKSITRMIPFIIGIFTGCFVALMFTVIGLISGNEQFVLLDLSAFSQFKWIPEFAFVKAFAGEYGYGQFENFGTYLFRIFASYVPISVVTFSEHIADHANLSSIVGEDLLKNPGLSRTLMGDGLGSIVGGIFGGCATTTYGESISCVGMSKNASTVTIFVTSIMAMVLSFIAPLTAFLSSIPSCVMGGVCVASYGFITVSGIKMIQKIDLNEMRNLFVVSAILITGVGSMSLNIGHFTLSAISVSLLLGILINIICNLDKKYF